MTSFKRFGAISLFSSFMATFAFAAPGSRVLTDDIVQPIHAGMKASEVLENIGPPLRKMRFERTATTAWDYCLQDSWGYRAEFSVIVDDNGTVLGKIAVRQDP